MGEDKHQSYLVKTLMENWRREMEAAKLYEASAQADPDERRKGIFRQLAQVEYAHAKMWSDKLIELKVDTSHLIPPTVHLSNYRLEDVVDRIEAVEQGNATWYQSLRNVVDDADILRMLDQIDADEANHDSVAADLQMPNADHRLRHIWGNERWHKQGTGDWVGDAIYGVNDGLGAIFGIIAGVAGYTSNSHHTVLISGLFGALASTLSMGAGAWLATKSEQEVMETAIRQERHEIDSDPEHEKEELALLYQLKGFSPLESVQIADKIAIDKEQFLKTMVQEELGFHELTKGNPWRSALFGSLSTLLGAMLPLIPFFFLTGISAMVVAAVVSLLAHFAVGAAKSMITVRSWWASGLEMTGVGILVGVVSYGLGLLGANLL